MDLRRLLASFARAFFLAFALILLPAAFISAPIGSAPALADDDDDDGGGDDDDDDGARPVRRAPDHVPNEVLLINPSEAALARSRALGFHVYATEIVSGSRMTVVRLRLPPGLDAPSALAVLRREAPDQVSDLNHIYRLQQVAGERASDVNAYACGSRCYGQTMIGWTSQLAACSEGLRIGVLDTGVDKGHSALAGQPVTSASFAPSLTLPSATSHGTAIAALLAGKGGGGSAPGLLPKAQIFAADVFHSSSGGLQIADSVSIARGLGWLKEQGVSVVNVSLAGGENRIVEAAVKDALAAGIDIVAAAGNDGPKAQPRFPAAIPGVIAVTAIDNRRRVYRRAAQGSHISYAAPGVNIWSAQPRSRYGRATGTSYAVPFVTGVLAVTQKSGGAKGATLPVEDLGAPGTDPVFGNGLIQSPRDCRTLTTVN